MKIVEALEFASDTQAGKPSAMEPKKVNRFTMAVATVLIVIWIGYLVYLGFHVREPQELVWTRLTSLLNSLEAVVFAAAGALFGTQVQKARVAKAEKTADDGVELAKKYVKSSDGLQAIFGQPTLNVAKDVTNGHDEMLTLANKILAEAK
ncbi:hypothetical protein ACQR1W_08270 [Bradyrhizobium sp. HKCCYLS1011]|uniref:hypothetical protein n=1 Tax=Bradyrhizobium sp. HKCCYLS1011 TaxID=3420733 RepID=UPI003EBB1D4C